MANETDGLAEYDYIQNGALQMRTRIFSALGAVALLTLIVALNNTAVIGVAVLIAAVLINYELFKALGFLEKKGLAIIGMFTPLLVLPYKLLDTMGFCAVLYIYVILLCTLMVLDHKRVSFSDIAKVITVAVVVTTFLYHIVLIREMDKGAALMWAVFVGACVSDTGAYFTGTFFGKHKLIPEISPKKTVEGAIGAVIFNVVAFLIYGVIINKLLDTSVNMYLLAVLGVLCSFVAQMGDLTASAIKRECEIKDFGAVLPGHGGVLDRFDSIMFVAPLVYYFVNLFPIF